MAPVKAEDDEVIAEYDVFLTPPIEEQVYLLQYPNRPRNRPYNNSIGASPHEMRIKPQSGFLELDVNLSTAHNFNKYMGLRWGDATRTAKEIHNSSGTFGPAAGLTMAKTRALSKAAVKDKADRELDLENDLRNFRTAEQEHKVFAKQTLGGQIVNHEAEAEQGKPHYFVGAFRDNQLHLTKITGTCQMRPHFHHLDAEEERARLAASRAQAETEGGNRPEPVARTLTQRLMEVEDKQTTEFKLRQRLREAEQEQWLTMEYVDEEDDEAYEEFNRKLKVADVSNLPHLKSQMDDDAFLDAISQPRHDSPTRRRRRAARKKQIMELEDEDEDEDEDEEEAELNARQAQVGNEG